MIFDLVSTTGMQAARLLAGTAMAGPLAPLFRHGAQPVRRGSIILYTTGIVVFIAYHIG